MRNLVEPIELCLESLDAADDERPYVRCVALAGGGPGLGLTSAGVVVWLQNQTAALLIWVSADNRLMIQRRDGSVHVRLTRAERFLDVPENKPVVTLHDDVIEIDGRSFRVHVHGIAQTVSAPERLTVRRARQWIAGAALAASLAACHSNPPGTTPVSPDPSTNGFAQPPPDFSTGGQSSRGSDNGNQGGSQGRGTAIPPIEIREQPPAPVPMPDRSGPRT
jgi:hypothetical protein